MDSKVNQQKDELDSIDIETLYEYDERLNDAKDKSQHEKDYEYIIAAANGSVKAKQLAALLIPKFFKYFPQLAEQALKQHWYLCEDEELGVRVQAIRGLPLFCKDTSEYLDKIVDILAQSLVTGENVERDAVNKALMTLLRQDVKTSLTALFKHVGNTEERSAAELSMENIREKVICFIKDKVFPLKAELLMPQAEMERHIANLVKQNLQDVSAAEFKMFMDFLKSLSLFGQSAPAERIQELVEIIEGHADLDAQFDVSDGDPLVRFISCLHMALPFFMRGASSSKFVNYLNKEITPVFGKLAEEQKLNLLKTIAECSLYATPQDSRQFLPSAVQLLKYWDVSEGRHRPWEATQDPNRDCQCKEGHTYHDSIVHVLERERTFLTRERHELQGDLACLEERLQIAYKEIKWLRQQLKDKDKIMEACKRKAKEICDILELEEEQSKIGASVAKRPRLHEDPEAESEDDPEEESDEDFEEPNE